MQSTIRKIEKEFWNILRNICRKVNAGKVNSWTRKRQLAKLAKQNPAVVYFRQHLADMEAYYTTAKELTAVI